jgi:serine-type D-Ala-D-Ala carboxypeptidase (penicillin-binding protein 5/6)
MKRLILSIFLALVVLTAFGSLPKVPIQKAERDVFAQVASHLKEHKNSYNIKTKTSFIQSANASEDNFKLNSYAVINYETGDVIAESNLDRKVSIASVTKIMTAVVALDLVEENELITITKNAARQIPTKIGVVPGEKMKLSELLDALLLTSANDAAEAIKDGVDAKYGEEVFIRAMNEKARFLGMNDSSFTNPQGFDARNHYSTAKDLAILSHYALENYRYIKDSVAKDYMFLPEDGNHKQFDLNNWNGLIGVYPGADGIKIGNTGRAGKTTIVTAEREGKKVLVVLLGAPGIIERDLWAAKLLDLGFEEFGIESADVTEEKLLAKYATWKYYN